VAAVNISFFAAIRLAVIRYGLERPDTVGADDPVESQDGDEHSPRTLTANGCGPCWHGCSCETGGL
jgi:hypothetical protein